MPHRSPFLSGAADVLSSNRQSRVTSEAFEQLVAELRQERCLNQLHQRINHCLTAYLQTTPPPSSLETTLFQIAAEELAAALGAGVAIVCPDSGNDRQAHRVVAIGVVDTLPAQFSQEWLKPGAAIPRPTWKQLLADHPQWVWLLSLPAPTTLLGWLVVIPEGEHYSEEAGAGAFIERVAQICTAAVQQARLTQTWIDRCQEQEVRNQELVQVNRLKSEFLANTSHEIRTPLSSILGFTHLLREQGYTPGNARQQEYLNIILSSGQHLLALINDILDLSKIEANQLDLCQETVTIAEICRTSLALIREKANDKGLAIKLETDPAMTTLVADPLRLRQMLFNLLSNAVKFTRQGEVGLRVQAGDGYVSFTVWDTGTGIPTQQQEQLFRPYVQLPNGAVGRHEGTGLGLALTQKLARLHGGWVEVCSEPSQGSQFTIVLPQPSDNDLSCPLMIPRQALTATTPQALDSVVDLPQGSHTLQPVNPPTEVVAPPTVGACASLANDKQPILLVEDHPPNARLIKAYLGKLGYEVVWVRNGEEMWQALSYELPRLILMDIQLPGVDGFTLIQQLRMRENYRNLPVIAQTAMAMVGDRNLCLEAGASDYISKPLDLKVLGTMIQRHLISGSSQSIV